MTYHLQGLLGLFVFFFIPLSLVHGSSKIWEGEIVRISGTKVYYKAQYTPYASATLYPVHCDTPAKEGKLLMIDFSDTVQSQPVHVPCIDDIPATGAEVIAAAKPGMRIIGFMNRKEWHYVSLVVRDADVEVGYVQELNGNELTLRRPQANWPNQMSNRESFSAQQFPDREFTLPLPSRMRGLDGEREVRASDLLKPGKAVMVMPASPMRVEWIPDPAQRWDPTVEPLKGRFSDYVKRSRPNVDVEFYQHGTTGILLEEKAVRRDIDNFGSGSTKPKDSWKIDVPYGPKQGEYILPSRGHKTQQIVAGHFNSFPTIPAMRKGRRVTAWAYRTQRAPNFLLFDAQEMEVEGAVESIKGSQVQLSVPGKDGAKTVEIRLDAQAEYYSLGKLTSKQQALEVGHVIRIYTGRPFTVVGGK